MVFSPSEIDLEEEGKKEFLFYCHIFLSFLLSSVSVDENNMAAKVLKIGTLRRAYYTVQKGQMARKKCPLIEHDGLFQPIYAFHQLYTQFIVIFVFGKIEKGRQSINLDSRKISMGPNFFYFLSGEITVRYKYEITVSWIQGTQDERS